MINEQVLKAINRLTRETLLLDVFTSAKGHKEILSEEFKKKFLIPGKFATVETKCVFCGKVYGLHKGAIGTSIYCP